MLKHHFTEGYNGREDRFFAWIEPVSGADLHSLLDLECDLGDINDEQDDVSLSVEIRGGVIEIRVWE